MGRALFVQTRNRRNNRLKIQFVHSHRLTNINVVHYTGHKVFLWNITAWAYHYVTVFLKPNFIHRPFLYFLLDYFSCTLSIYWCLSPLSLCFVTFLTAVSLSAFVSWISNKIFHKREAFDPCHSQSEGSNKTLVFYFSYEVSTIACIKGKELELLFYASPLSISLSLTFLRLFLYTKYAVRVLYLVRVLYPVHSPWSTVRSPCFILTGYQPYSHSENFYYSFPQERARWRKVSCFFL